MGVMLYACVRLAPLTPLMLLRAAKVGASGKRLNIVSAIERAVFGEAFSLNS